MQRKTWLILLGVVLCLLLGAAGGYVLLSKHHQDEAANHSSDNVDKQIQTDEVTLDKMKQKINQAIDEGGENIENLDADKLTDTLVEMEQSLNDAETSSAETEKEITILEKEIKEIKQMVKGLHLGDELKQGANTLEEISDGLESILGKIDNLK